MPLVATIVKPKEPRMRAAGKTSALDSSATVMNTVPARGSFWPAPSWLFMDGDDALLTIFGSLFGSSCLSRFYAIQLSGARKRLVMAPILSFTAEEVFRHTAVNQRGTGISVFSLEPLTTDAWKLDETTRQRFELVSTLRGEVTRAIEPRRKAGEVGHSLETAVVLYLPDALRADVEALGMTTLSFQDLTGQRIKRIIEAIKKVEAIVFDLYLSTGIQLKARAEAPDRAIAELEAEAKEKVSALKGPQTKVKQGDVDDLLAQLGLD